MRPETTPEQLLPPPELFNNAPEQSPATSSLGKRLAGLAVAAGLSFGVAATTQESETVHADAPQNFEDDDTAIQPGEVLEVTVAGENDIPADAQQAYLNLTVTGAEDPGFLSVVDCHNPQPNTSIINYDAETNSTRANNAIVQLDADGNVCLMPSQSATDILVDVTAVDSGTNPLLQTPKEPIRVDDSRTDEIVQTGQERLVQVAGNNGVPKNAHTVMLTLTATQPNQPGYVSAKACDGQPAETSSVNFKTQENGSTTILVDLDENGQFCVGASQSDVHVIADVMAWTTDPNSPIETFDSPRRVDDSRPDAQVTAYGKRVVQVAGENGVPENADTVFANLTGLSDLATYMSVGNCESASAPNSSLLNLNGGSTIDAKANGAIISLGNEGDFCIYGGNGSVGTGVLDSIVDVAGYIREGATPEDLQAFQDPIRVEDSRVENDGSGGGGSSGPSYIEEIILEKPYTAYVDKLSGVFTAYEVVRYMIHGEQKGYCGLDFDTTGDGRGDSGYVYDPCPIAAWEL